MKEHLRLAHNDYEYTFNYLLKFDDEVTFSVKNNQKLMIEEFQYFNGVSNSITNEIFSKRNIEYNIRNYRELASRELASYRKLRVNMVEQYGLEYGLESANYKTSTTKK